mgnify:FL=1
MCELARISLNDAKEEDKFDKIRKACKHIEKMTNDMGDEILGRQFLESKFHEDLIAFCKEHQILSVKNDQ